MNNKTAAFLLILAVTAISSCMGTKLETTYNKQEDQIDKYVSSKIAIPHKVTISDTLGFEIDTTFKYDTTYAFDTTFTDPITVDTTMTVDSIVTRIDTTWNIETRDSSWTDSLKFVRNGGSNRIVTKEGEGPELEADGYVSFYYAGYTFNGSFNASGLFITNHQATAEQAGWSLTDAEYELYEINLKDDKLIPGLKDGLLGVQEGEECDILFTGKYGFGNEVFGIIPANSALLYRIWVVAVSND